MRYSFIIPVYNRPDEVDELLHSISRQTYKDFEVLVVEDGSHNKCDHIVDRYKDLFPVRYYYKENSGPGQTRNYAAERSNGEYLIILDSDCVLPDTYLQAVENELLHSPADAFGGPDAAHESFTDVQKAISYSMTSFFTTGGIRGGKKKMDKFYPRSFNMGVRRDTYMALGGFSKMRFGEDIDFSIRIFKAGYKCRLFPDAWVWHKRRTDMKKFFKQVHNSGIARINLYKKYPESLKLVHLLPMVFTLGVAVIILSVLAGAIGRVWIWQMQSGYPYAVDMPHIMDYAHIFNIMMYVPLSLLFLFSLIIFVDSSRLNRSMRIGLISVVSSFVQLTGYGSGFIISWWKRCVLGQNEFSAFEKSFYK